MCTAGGDNTVNKEELGKGQQQVAESRIRLLKLKADRDLDVTAVRVAGDERESQRRSKEEEQRQVSAVCNTVHDTIKGTMTKAMLPVTTASAYWCYGICAATSCLSHMTLAAQPPHAFPNSDACWMHIVGTCQSNIAWC